MRSEGLSFAAIASRLGLRRSKDAFEAFHRSLQARSAEERQQVIREELGRLDTLEARIRSRDAAAPQKMQQRLEALEGMRERIGRAGGT